jgi:hypothetical protein
MRKEEWPGNGKYCKKAVDPKNDFLSSTFKNPSVHINQAMKD